MTNQKKWILGGAGLLLLILIFSGWQAGKKTDSRESGNDTAVSGEDWIKGRNDAPVTLVEYTDFQCPACAAYFPVMKQLMASYPDQLRVVIRHYPLVRIHPNSLAASRAAEAAGKQGKFFEMHDILFTRQNEWAKLDDPKEKFLVYAAELGVDREKFSADMASDATTSAINRGLKLGDQDGVQGTPNFVLNGQRIENPANVESFKALIDEALGTQASVKSEAGAANETREVVHEHADFKVYLNGQPFDFAQAKYQSTKEKELSESLHLHDATGNVIHKHFRGATLGEYFQSLGMELTKGCLRLDTGEAYCSGPVNTLKIWVNGQPSEKFDTLEFQDGDRILVSYGAENQKALQAQMDSVTRDSCIYSEKCPDRGTPPAEECVGGLGTDCVKE